jgi:hypothetical protein
MKIVTAVLAAEAGVNPELIPRRIEIISLAGSCSYADLIPAPRQWV